jgi:uncharacterized membrane protein YfcA
MWKIVAVFLVVLIAGVVSGMAGGGGAFITLPFLIALGLTPQQAIATTKFSVFGSTLGGTAAFKKRAFQNRKLIIFLMSLAFLISLIVPHVFNKLSSHVFQMVLGVVMLLMVPVVLRGKHGLESRHTSKMRKIIGGVLAALVFLLQGIFSGGIGALNNIVFISFFGLSALQANATKRISSLALNTFIVIVFITTTNYIIYKLAFAGVVACFIGTYIGSHIALRKGENFARYALVAFMVLSGLGLLFIK